MNCLKFLYSKPPSLVLYKTLELFAHKTRSTPHESLLIYAKDFSKRPIFLFGFARSGTTTFQKIISDSFSYNTSFEPIGFNHSNWDPENFRRISAFFRGAPSIEDLDLYNIGEGVFSAIHIIRNIEVYNSTFLLLKGYISHLLKHYGHNVVIKELRLITNLESVSRISKELNVNPIFILLKCDPFAVIYTYYRLGGLIETNDFGTLRVNEIFQYRKMIYEHLNLFSDILRIIPANKYDKLLLSILLDQKYMHFYANNNPDTCLFVDFEKSVTALDEIAKKFNLVMENMSEIKLRNFHRYKLDRYFMRYLMKKLNPELVEIVKKEFSCKWGIAPKPSQNIKVVVTFLQQKILEFSNQ